MLADLLDRHAVDRPRAPALVAGTSTITWDELRELVRRLAAGLSARGVSPGEFVALLLPNCPAFVTGLLACARLGSVAVPLSPDLKKEQIRRALKASGCLTLLAAPSFCDLARDLRQDGSILRAFLNGCDAPGLENLSRLAADGTGSVSPPLPAEEDAFLGLFTSGTTGPPSRVIRTHGALVRMTTTFASTAGISAADRVLAVVPFSHGHGLNNTLLAALVTGATLVLQERFNRRETLRLLGQERITVFPTVPFMAGILADTKPSEALDLSALRLSVSAGSALTQETWLKVKSRLGIELRQSFGSTETGMVTFDADGDASPESVGRPLDGVTIATFGDSDEPLGSGIQGELGVRTPWAADWRDSPNGRQPVADANGWIRMKDVGRVDAEGRLHLTGNNAIVINVAGRKVDPLEVEATLMRHPDVREALVIALRGSFGEQAVQAIVVPRRTCSADDLLAHCQERLAAYQVPRVIRFRSVLPRSAAGKVMRGTLEREGIDDPVTTR